MLDLDKIREDIKGGPVAPEAEGDAEMIEGGESEAGQDHYGELFDALKSGDKAAGVAALKACLGGE